MMDPWIDVCTLVMISAVNMSSVAEQQLFIGISAVNESSVAENQLHPIIATWNMFYDESREGCVLFGHNICYECV